MATHGLAPVNTATDYFTGDVEDWQNAVKDWSGSSACEKIALAEWLAEAMRSAAPVARESSQKWTPGTDPMSLRAGRAKWAFELLLGVKLPGTVQPRPSPEYLEQLRESAHLALEAYRQGIIARAAEDQVPPAEFARLKRKYRGRIPWGPWAPDSGIRPGNLGMDEFLMVWPPIGRKYEDLVSLIGVKGQPEDDGVSYTFDDAPTAYRYRFVIQEGVIRSVKKSAF
jgi:hypothetical protein